MQLPAEEKLPMYGEAMRNPLRLKAGRKERCMETEDVILRDWADTDAQSLYEMCLDDTLRKSGVSFYDSISQSRKAIDLWKNNPGCKVILGKAANCFVGFVHLGDMNRYNGYMEMEYAIIAAHRNKGYATQAVKEALDYGFKELKIAVIAAWVRSHNQASMRVLEKCGFMLEGKLRKHARDGSDTYCYSILREEWESWGS